MDCPSPTIDDVFAAVGTELCSFLAPRDLLPLSLSNQHIFKNVREKLVVICLKQLSKLPAINDGAAASTAAASVVITKNHSFATKGKLTETLIENIKFANLRYNPRDRLDYTDTLQETLALTNKAIADEWNNCAWYGTFKTDPAEIWKPIQKPHSVGCRFDKGLWSGSECVIDWMLRGLGQKNTEVNHPILKDWARYVVAQEGIVGREWHWQCDGREEVGFMMYTPEGGEQMEIRLIKTTKAAEPAPAATSTPSLLSALGF